MKEKSGLESIKIIGTIPAFKERVNDAINNFQALRLSLMTDSYEEVIQNIQGEKMFTHFEDYLLKKDNYVLSPEIKQSQQTTIDKYNSFIDRTLNGKDIKELKEINNEAILYLKEVSK